MEQLQNGLLTMLQTTLQQVPGVGGKSESSSGDEFQKLLERAQNPQDVEQPEPAKKPQAARQERKEAPAPKKEEDPVEAVKRMQVYLTPVPPEELAQYPESWLPQVEEGEAIFCIGVQMDENGQQIPILIGENEAFTRFGRVMLAPEVQPQGEIELPEEMLLETSEEPVLAQTAPQTELEVQPQEEAPVEDLVESVQVETGAPEENTEDTTQDKDLSAEAQPLFRSVEAAPIKVGDAPAVETTSQQAPVGDQVAGALDQALAQGETKVELQLTPENLGKVSIELHFDKSGSLESILMSAERRGTLDLLTKNVPDMMRAFGQRYGQEVRVEVQQPQESQQQQQQRQYDGHNGHNGQPQGEERQHRRRPHSENPQDFLHQLRLGLIETDE